MEKISPSQVETEGGIRRVQTAKREEPDTGSLRVNSDSSGIFQNIRQPEVKG